MDASNQQCICRARRLKAPRSPEQKGAAAAGAAAFQPGPGQPGGLCYLSSSSPEADGLGEPPELQEGSEAGEAQLEPAGAGAGAGGGAASGASGWGGAGWARE